MRFISLFAGIGGFDLALERHGHECVYVNEWDKYAAQTYEKNFGRRPDTRDITTVPAEDIPDHDLLVGGFPCQSFSVAGLRKGFADTRGTLFFDIARILEAKRPAYLLLENVKGLLSHDTGRTFQTILWTLDALGYDLQWQVCNSKNFGVPQNRERVFIVGHLRGQSRPEVFPFRGDAKTDSGQVTSTAIDANYWKGIDNHGQRTAIAVAPTIRASDYKNGDTQTVVAQRVPLKFLERNQKSIEGDYAYTVDSMHTGGVMVGTLRTHKDGNGFREMKSGVAPTIPARAREDGSGQPVVAHTVRSSGRGSPHGAKQNWDSYEFQGKIRRLTPLECERLQGFPDGWTEGVSDTQRYKQLGNAVTVNVVQSIMEQFI